MTKWNPFQRSKDDSILGTVLIEFLILIDQREKLWILSFLPENSHNKICDFWKYKLQNKTHRWAN